MTKYVFLNDSKRPLTIHGGSNETTTKKPGDTIEHGNMVVVESNKTDDDVPFIKVWGNTVLLSFISNEVYEAMK